MVIDADRLAREVVEPGTDGFGEVVAEFGSDVVGVDGRLDRPALAAVVFGDTDARGRLEAIIHPRVGARTGELLADAPEDAIVVHDVPLLVEAGLAPSYHLVMVVEAPQQVRIQRLVADRGMTVEQAAERIAAQASPEQRRAAADVILDNSGNPVDLHAQVDQLWDTRLRPYEENVRLRRRLRRDERLTLSPYDPTWPVQGRRIVDRIRLAMGERARRVDHVGSTSVPGLLAKDVIDVLVTVAELADADAARDGLEAAGFPCAPDNRGDVPRPYAPDPRDWEKRFHGYADPARPVHVHLLADGAAGWRVLLLVRDWLRADPEAVAEYAAEKKRIAETERTVTRYGEAKEPWFDAAVPRAEEWAERTGWQP